MEILAPITIYKTKDGRIFENEKEARSHEIGLNFYKWYLTTPSNQLRVLGTSYDSYVSTMPADVMRDWIVKNRKMLLFILQGENI